MEDTQIFIMGHVQASTAWLVPGMQPLFLTHDLPKHTTPLSKVLFAHRHARWDLPSVRLKGQIMYIQLGFCLFALQCWGWNADWSMSQTRTPPLNNIPSMMHVQGSTDKLLEIV